LDDIAGFIAFSELEQSKNIAGEMVPLGNAFTGSFLLSRNRPSEDVSARLK
jgi:hypothetical protein